MGQDTGQFTVKPLPQNIDNTKTIMSNDPAKRHRSSIVKIGWLIVLVLEQESLDRCLIGFVGVISTLAEISL